jgi:sugar/nucleoside kinase (ribokinase family)
MVVAPPDVDVCGIGNALVDVIAHADDAQLAERQLVKGTMVLVPTEEEAEALYAQMGAAVEMSGGSTANAIAGLANLGGRGGFIGRVRDDQLGAVFAHDLRAIGVAYRGSPATDGPPTGRCLILVTPDAQRTMRTYLGASALLGPDDIDADLVASAAITFLEGFLFDTPENRKAYRRASQVARGAGRRVAISFSDVFCVERHRDEWLSLLIDHVDVVFANEAEITALYERDDVESCIDEIREQVEVAVVTRGEHGAIVATADDTIAVPAHPVPRVVDTTGAGDQFAAGFLYGLTHGFELERCARLGTLAAAAVISHMGARPEADLRALAGEAGLL